MNKKIEFNKIKLMYGLIFLASTFGSQVFASQVVNLLEVLQASAVKGSKVKLSLSTLGAFSYTDLKNTLRTALVPLTEVTGQGSLTKADTFSFEFGNTVGFAMPNTSWPKTAVPNLYTLLSGVSGFNLSQGVTYVVLAFDANNNLITDLTKYPNFTSSVNFYLFAYSAQGTSLFPAGIALPISTMGYLPGSGTTIATNTVNVDLNIGSEMIVNQTVNYPGALIVTQSGSQTGNQIHSDPSKSSLTKPTAQSKTISLQPNVDPSLLSATTQFLVIPSTVTAIEVIPSTNVGDLYTSFSFNAANLAKINAALTEGTSLQFALNVQQNNSNYNVTGTVYDFSNNVIATETFDNVINAAAAGVTNTANIAPGAPITAPSVFSYYDIQVTLSDESSSSEPITLSRSGMTLSSTVILEAPIQSVKITSPVQFIEIECQSSVASLSINELVSAQNLLDINAALAAGQTLTMAVLVMPNGQGNYDFSFNVYNDGGFIIAQEYRSSVTNGSQAANSANIAYDAVIPSTAATFTGSNVQVTFLDTQEVLTIENLSFTDSIALVPTIPSSSVVTLPDGINALTDLTFNAEFGATVSGNMKIEDLAEINAAIAGGDSVSVQCIIENDQILIGAYNFTKNLYIVMVEYDLPENTTAEEFSGYTLQYLVQGQTPGTTAVPAAQTFQCAVNQAITFLPVIAPVVVNPFYMAGRNGGMSFVPNQSSLSQIISSTEQPYNQESPVSVIGGLDALDKIRVQFTDANQTTFLAFDFTKTAGLQNITQELLNNGLYICYDILANTPSTGQFSAQVSLEDAQGNVYAYGTAPITTQMIYGIAFFNMDQASTPMTGTTTWVNSVPLSLGQAVLYRQQTITTPAQ